MMTSSLTFWKNSTSKISTYFYAICKSSMGGLKFIITTKKSFVHQCQIQKEIKITPEPYGARTSSLILRKRCSEICSVKYTKCDLNKIAKQLFFLFGFSFTNILDSQGNRVRENLKSFNSSFIWA